MKEIPAPSGAGQSPKEDEELDGLAAIHGIAIKPERDATASAHESGLEDLFTHMF